MLKWYIPCYRSGTYCLYAVLLHISVCNVHWALHSWMCKTENCSFCLSKMHYAVSVCLVMATDHHTTPSLQWWRGEIWVIQSTLITASWTRPLENVTKSLLPTPGETTGQWREGWDGMQTRKKRTGGRERGWWEFDWLTNSIMWLHGSFARVKLNGQKIVLIVITTFKCKTGTLLTRSLNRHMPLSNLENSYFSLISSVP